MTQLNHDAQSDYRRLFERIPYGVYQTTPSGHIVAANPALLEMLGYQSLEELARVDVTTKHYVDPSAKRAWAQQLERDGHVQDMEITLRRSDGRQIVVLDNASVVRDDNGDVLFYEGTLTDITARPTTAMTPRGSTSANPSQRKPSPSSSTIRQDAKFRRNEFAFRVVCKAKSQNDRQHFSNSVGNGFPLVRNRGSTR